MSDHTHRFAVDPRAIEHALFLLQDALAEVDVWRQHAREAAELPALRRLAVALGGASEELRSVLGSAEPDPSQASILEELSGLRPTG